MSSDRALDPAPTDTGFPASSNIAPAPDLNRVVARFFLTAIDQQEESTLEDFLLNENAVIQMPVSGELSWRGEDGAWRTLNGPTLFGPRGRALRVKASGSTLIAGVVIRPCGWASIDPRPAAAVADRIEVVASDWRVALAGATAGSTDGIIARLQHVVRGQVAAMGATTSANAAIFEALVRAESNTPVAQAATSLGMNMGTFDRFVRRHFGHGPKMVMRRSRFLDMAGVLHGLAAKEIDAVAEERFYDASHLNREFRTFVDMTPGGFARAYTPLLNAELTARHQVAAI